ncbi:MAG TPA: hypothetical protein VNF49_11280, partial [Candidatus Binataceae bacterium]|nr:hypothetical protein [Candidatus Binataceae bacterium]
PQGFSSLGLLVFPGRIRVAKHKVVGSKPITRSSSKSVKSKMRVAPSIEVRELEFGSDGGNLWAPT